MVDAADITSSPIARIFRAWGLYGLIFILLAAILINGEVFDIRTELVMAYAILLIGFMRWYDIKVDDFTTEFGAKKKLWDRFFNKVNIPENSIVRGFVYYVTFFAFTWLFLVSGLLLGLIPRGTIAIQSVIPTLITQIIIVSVIETLVFQVMLFIILKREFVDQANISFKYAIIPIILISQTLFGLFHWVAFSGNLFSVFIATISGVAFFIFAWFSSPVAAMSCHASYNLFVLGITSGGIFGLGSATLTIMTLPVIVLIIIGFVVSISRRYTFMGPTRHTRIDRSRYTMIFIIKVRKIITSLVHTVRITSVKNAEVSI